ncbi:MAG: STAS domain-containing protein [Candidatus Omnitrophica bacterium]|nr:STAS domain-containing protein [Candidatus Omnitrophota bacterium]
MQITQREVGQAVILDLSGEIDINTSPEVRLAFDELLKQEKKKVLLNFAEVAYIDSSGLATLVEMLQRLKRYAGALRLASVSEKVRGLFEITKLDKLFGIFPNVDEALKDF